MTLTVDNHVTKNYPSHLLPEYDHRVRRLVETNFNDLVLHMASSLPAPTDVYRLRTEGFIVIQDETIGGRVKGMRQKRFPIRTADGLTFCKQTVLDDTVRAIHSLVEFC